MRKGLSTLLLAASLGGTAPAEASFHLWDVSEVYTNADGSVQFIEFFTTASGQEFLVGHLLQTSTEGVTDSIYTVPGNLPVGTGESTADRHFLFASPGFEAVAGIAPDYEWTGALSFIHVGTNDFVELVGADEISLAHLPTDGMLSLLGDGVTTATPTPTNFAGETGRIVPEPSAAGLALGSGAALLGWGGIRRGASTRRRVRAGTRPAPQSADAGACARGHRG